MRFGSGLCALAATVLALIAASGSSQTKPAYDAASAVMGASTFKTYCASCHGSTARGDGPLAEHLRFTPPDLTRIARRNGGKYPLEKVVKIIDGREPVKGHGGTDMPIWGDAFKSSREGFDAEKVQLRIEELAHFLASVQESPDK